MRYSWYKIFHGLSYRQSCVHFRLFSRLFTLLSVVSLFCTSTKGIRRDETGSENRVYRFSPASQSVREGKTNGLTDIRAIDGATLCFSQSATHRAPKTCGSWTKSWWIFHFSNKLLQNNSKKKLLKKSIQKNHGKLLILILILIIKHDRHRYWWLLGKILFFRVIIIIIAISKTIIFYNI